MAEPRFPRAGGISVNNRGSGFAGQIGKFKDTVNRRATFVHKDLSYQLFVNITLDTPVDKGEARGGWNPSLNAPDLTDLGGRLDPSGAGVIKQIEAVIDSAGYEDIVFFSNVVEHIVPLEYGWSQRQAPNGMVRINIARFRGLVSQSVQKSKRA